MSSSLCNTNRLLCDEKLSPEDALSDVKLAAPTTHFIQTRSRTRCLPVEDVEHDYDDDDEDDDDYADAGGDCISLSVHESNGAECVSCWTNPLDVADMCFATNCQEAQQVGFKLIELLRRKRAQFSHQHNRLSKRLVFAEKCIRHVTKSNDKKEKNTDVLARLCRCARNLRSRSAQVDATSIVSLDTKDESKEAAFSDGVCRFSKTDVSTSMPHRQWTGHCQCVPTALRNRRS